MKITVIGLGRLGTVAAAGLAAAGHEVTGLDVDGRRVRELRGRTDSLLRAWSGGVPDRIS